MKYCFAERSRLGFVALSMIVLSACGGGPAGTPTAIPASVSRPQQATPVYSVEKPAFEAVSGVPTVIVEEEASSDVSAIMDEVEGPEESLTLLALPPSAMGIAPGGATVFASPGGAEVASVPAGGLLTVTGRSADGQWLAVYNNEAIAGWTPVSRLRLYGADDLTVVATAFSPAPIATLLADAMLPPATSVLDAAMTAIAQTPRPTSTETPQP